jgi:hypothetical protein
MWETRNNEEQYLSYFEDSIYIYYNGSTGTCFVNIGDQTGLSVQNLDAVESSFKPAENENDYSGFAAGVDALDKAIQSNSLNVTVVVSAVIAGVIILAAIAYIIVKKKKKQTK